MKTALFLSALLLSASAQAYDTLHFGDPLSLSQAKRPWAVAAGGGRAYVLDGKTGKVFIFDLAEGRPVGEVDAGLKAPRGLAAGDGKVYVADTGHDRVVILDADGKVLSSFGQRGSQAGALKDPAAVAVGRDGRVYVADTGNDRVEVFTSEGILLTELSEPAKIRGHFDSPAKLAVDPSDDLYVLDTHAGKVQVFGPDARFLRDFSVDGEDFVVDDYGFAYSVEPGSGKVIEYSPGGMEQGRFGSRGTGAGQFKRAQALALAGDGKLLILDQGLKTLDPVDVANQDKTSRLPLDARTRMFVSGPSRTWKAAAGPITAGEDGVIAYLPDPGVFSVLGPDGSEVRRFGKKGKSDEATRQAAGLAWNAKLGLYVSDGPADRVQRFSKDGKWQANFGQSTGFFDGHKKEGRVNDPRGLAINDKGTVYVADAGNRRVDEFNLQGVYFSAIGPELSSKDGQYQLQEPSSVAWDGRDRFLYFVDRGLKKVFKCEPSGALLASWGREGDAPGEFRSPEAIAYDGRSYLYILDRTLKRVSVFDKDGDWLTDLFSGGEQDNNLGDPVALAISGSQLLISDAGRGRVVSFQLHPSLAAPASVSTATREGSVELSWEPVSDPWTRRYRVWRADAADGPFVEVGRSDAPSFSDDKVEPGRGYWYKVATEAKTGEVGAAGLPVQAVAAAAVNRSPVEISTVALGDLFPANYKWYLSHPAGSVTVTNNVDEAFENVKLSFRLKDFMDFGYDTQIKTLRAHQSVDVPLIATLNNRILDVTEETPIQAEFTLTYFQDGQERTVSLTRPLRVYSRNAITWQDPRRIGNFVTPNDTPVFDFGRAALHDAPTAPQAEALAAPVVTAVHLWDALSAAGVSFMANPSDNYETVSADPNFPVDYTQFPRETLKRKSGQCDDLTTLLVSLLDSANVRSAVLDYPGHMALLFDTGEDDSADVGLPEDMLVRYEETWWVPVEPTLIGRPFDEAVRKAAFAYQQESQKGDARVVDVRKAWEDFAPATMPPADWHADAPAAQASAKRFAAETGSLFDAGYKFLSARYLDELKKSPQDADARLRLGYLDYEAGKKAAAGEQFRAVLKGDPSNAAALNDLGNIAFLSGDYAGAESRYSAAAQAQPEDADLWLNLVKAEVHLKNKDKAAAYGKKAVAADSDAAPAVETLLK